MGLGYHHPSRLLRPVPHPWNFRSPISSTVMKVSLVLWLMKEFKFDNLENSYNFFFLLGFRDLYFQLYNSEQDTKFKHSLISVQINLLIFEILFMSFLLLVLCLLFPNCFRKWRPGRHATIYSQMSHVTFFVRGTRCAYVPCLVLQYSIHINFYDTSSSFSTEYCSGKEKSFDSHTFIYCLRFHQISNHVSVWLRRACGQNNFSLKYVWFLFIFWHVLMTFLACYRYLMTY